MIYHNKRAVSNTWTVQIYIETCAIYVPCSGISLKQID